MSNGKGSKRRPMQVSREEFERNWDEAFGKKDQPSRRELIDGVAKILKSDSRKEQRE